MQAFGESKASYALYALVVLLFIGGISAKFQPRTGWIQLKSGNKMIYVLDDYNLAYGQQVIDGNTYYFDSETGTMCTGFVQEEDGIHYYDDSGIMVTGILSLNNETYCFDESGVMISEDFFQMETDEDSFIVYFDEEGKMVTGEYTVEGRECVFSDIGEVLVNTDFLKSNVQKILNQYDGEISVYYKNLRTDQSFSIRADQTYYPCSIIKLAALIATYDAMEKGTVTYDENIENWITAMITVSDNTSFNNLIVEIGEGDGEKGAATVNELLKEIGCKNTLIEHSLQPGTNLWRIGSSNISCPSDIGLLLEKLYKKEVVTEEKCEEMIEILKQCADSNEIQAGLPSYVEYAHKTGWADNYYHDGGIVYTSKDDYILVIFSDGADYTNMMAEVSAFIYDYQMNLYPDIEK